MNFIEKANENLKLDEGSIIIENLLIKCYLSPGISTKELSRNLYLPVPITVAIKKELIKAGVLLQDKGVRCTMKGKAFVEQELGFKGIKTSLYQKLLKYDGNALPDLSDVLLKLQDLFPLRPQVDVQIDQSQCTPDTSLRRALLCLKEHSLIGKRILCVGDDDLVSISIGLLLKKLFPSEHSFQTQIDVMDIDKRFLKFIKDFAEKEGLPINCIYHDMRHPFKEDYVEKYDCFFTDPPYTLQGMNLFLSRGVSALKKRKGLNIFLSFAHKSPEFTLKMQQAFVEMGLSVNATLPSFNKYVGAQMIANRSQMMIIKTTDHTTVPANLLDKFTGPLYTGEVKQSTRIYRCTNCGGDVKVGTQCSFQTIEQLKREKCPYCFENTFLLKNRI
ncbi:bis-aminopropyl spermidine synthase family protein [Bacillus sp. Bva_UNVM-123]|uniref:bis-aminopropyl spermidine synthase family protein n=1 Tax=Bacillus sp. Bva_UNVM-123 TaxID=2829798 RepID=UPI00391F2BD1